MEALDAADRLEDAGVEDAGFAAEADAGAPAADAAPPDAVEEAAVAGDVSPDRALVGPALPAPPVAVPTSPDLSPAPLPAPLSAAGELTVDDVGADFGPLDDVSGALSLPPFTSRALPSIVGGGPDRFMIGGTPFADEEDCGVLPAADEPLSDAAPLPSLRSPSSFPAMPFSMSLAQCDRSRDSRITQLRSLPTQMSTRPGGAAPISDQCAS